MPTSPTIVLQTAPGDPRGLKTFNETLAADPRLESIILPIYRDKLDGLSISRVK